MYTLRLKYTKFDFGWGSAQDPAEELTVTALPKQRPLDPLLDFRGSTSNGRERIESNQIY